MAMTIEIVADFVCPYCWLGKKRLDAALAERPDTPVQLVWRPFELDSDVPAEGAPYRDYMTRLFGGGADAGARLDQAWAGLTQTGAAEGADFRFKDISVRPNTLDAHRLMRWAQAGDAPAGAGAAVAEGLFNAVFHDGRDIGDRAVLAEIAGAAGMDADAVRARLDSDEDADQVRAEAAQFQQMGVTGVPTFIFDRRMAMVGAQDHHALVEALDRAAA